MTSGAELTAALRLTHILLVGSRPGRCAVVSDDDAWLRAECARGSRAPPANCGGCVGYLLGSPDARFSSTAWRMNARNGSGCMSSGEVILT